MLNSRALLVVMALAGAAWGAVLSIPVQAATLTAGFTGTMTAAQLQAEVTRLSNDGWTVQEIADAAILAKVGAGPLTTAMLAAKLPAADVVAAVTSAAPTQSQAIADAASKAGVSDTTIQSAQQKVATPSAGASSGSGSGAGSGGGGTASGSGT